MAATLLIQPLLDMTMNTRANQGQSRKRPRDLQPTIDCPARGGANLCLVPTLWRASTPAEWCLCGAGGRGLNKRVNNLPHCAQRQVTSPRQWQLRHPPLTFKFTPTILSWTWAAIAAGKGMANGPVPRCSQQQCWRVQCHFAFTKVSRKISAKTRFASCHAWLL